MLRSVIMVWLAGLMALSAGAASAQAPAKPGEKPAASTAPTVRTFVTGGDEVLKKLEGVMKLSTPADQKMWPRFVEYFEVFLIGVDRAKITRSDLLLDEETERVRFSVPIAPTGGNILKGFDVFRNQNLNPLGINTRRIGAAQFYQLSNAFTGFMRFNNGYASIGEKKDDLPLMLPDPSKEVPNLLARKFDAAVEGFNIDGGQDERRALHKKRRATFLATLKRKDTESADDFEIRRTFIETQFDEMERLYVEGSQFLLGGVVNGAKSARFELEMSAIPDTDFDKSICTQGEKPSRFASVARVADPIASGRINFPLDEMRINNIIRISKVMRAASINQIEAGKERSADEKAAAKQAASMFFDLVDAGAKTGRIDGFVEAHANKSGKNTLVWGVVPEDGNAVLDILKLLPKSGKDNKVELDFATEGDVKIHRVTAPSGFRTEAKDFFGEETVLIGTSKDLLYLAAGENALEELKAAIRTPADEKAAQETLPTIIDGFIKLAPWTELWHKRLGTKGDVKMRERAVTAFKAGDDVLTLKALRDDPKGKEGEGKPRPRITGTMEGKAGVLRFIGATMAEFTRNIDK
jgi:hypothetical protein